MCLNILIRIENQGKHEKRKEGSGPRQTKEASEWLYAILQ